MALMYLDGPLHIDDMDDRVKLVDMLDGASDGACLVLHLLAIALGEEGRMCSDSARVALMQQLARSSDPVQGAQA